MVAQTFISEDAYYMRILEKYQQYLDGDLEDVDTFTSHEINFILHQLKELNGLDSENKTIMQNITRNSMILLLSLFPNEKHVEYYKEYAALTSDEQETLKYQLSLMM